MRTSPRPGDFLGPYLLLRQVGLGGMAQVFKAERRDGRLPRYVAVKLVRCDVAGDPALEQRFHAERQILSVLNHPHIARLLDGGSADQGAQYVVMEFVEGASLGVYLDQASPSLEARLRLFLELCDAVQYAHRHLIVHRDIKPDNVLITLEGHVKLLDFGIAKLLRPEFWRGVDPAVTRPAERLATPEFASPEQLRGEPATTASDIYSLGAVLYYILSERLPFDCEGLDWHQVAYQVCEQDPAPLTDTPGDLVAITAKALRKAPGERYDSAAHLADEIRRHMDGRPVHARRGEWLYPARRWIRRNAAAAALATSLALVLAASAASLWRLSHRLAAERDAANASTDFLTDLFSTVDPTSTEPQTVHQLLAEASERLEKRLGDQPRERAALAEKIGDVYRQLGDYDRAEPLARLALKLHEQLYGADSPPAARNMVRLADLLRERHQYEEALTLAERSLAVRRAALGADHTDVADSLNMVGILNQIVGRLKESEAAFTEAVSIRRSTLPESPLLALSLGNLGNVLRERGNYPGAEALYREAVAIRKKALGPRHPRVASSLGQISQTALARHDAGEALGLTTEAVGILRGALPAGHPDIARTLIDHGNAQRAAGLAEESERTLREALAIYRKSHGAESPEASFAESALAQTLAARGKGRDAERHMNHVVAARRKALGAGHPRVALAMRQLAELRGGASAAGGAR